MTSDEINAAIIELDADENRPYRSCIGQKIIPYIGWYWRTVYFDDTSAGYGLGVIPAHTGEGNDNWKNDIMSAALRAMNPPNKKPLVGFMENNKWGYPTIHLNSEEWEQLKRLIVEAVESVKTLPHAECVQKFRAVDEYMQSFLSRMEPTQ